MSCELCDSVPPPRLVCGRQLADGRCPFFERSHPTCGHDWDPYHRVEIWEGIQLLDARLVRCENRPTPVVAVG